MQELRQIGEVSLEFRQACAQKAFYTSGYDQAIATYLLEATGRNCLYPKIHAFGQKLQAIRYGILINRQLGIKLELPQLAGRLLPNFKAKN